MDFSKVKSLTIPEGVVTQIADASGRVLWSAVENLTVTMTKANPSGVEAYISWDGGSASELGTYQVPAGTSMKAFIKHSKTLTGMSNYIFLNGESTSMSGYSDAVYIWSEYDFTLTKDITFYVGTYGKGAYALFIEEV